MIEPVAKMHPIAWPNPIEVAGVVLAGDPDGVAFWPEQNILIVADLHLEKGSSFAERGVLLPPYDTASTLARLGRCISHYAPRCVIALGDSFHVRRAPTRLVDTDRAALRLMQRGRDWIWIAGNHDPDPADGVGGNSAPELKIGQLTFRHIPSGESGEIAGHLHPVARVRQRGRVISRRCFVADASRMVMPAFGAYTGGLNIRDTAFADIFESLAFTAHMLGDRRIFAIAARRCLRDRA